MKARKRARLLALIGAFALALLPLLTAAPARADPNNFSYASWDGSYQLSRDQDGRAKLTVTETLVADFPEYDQNHGIIRGLPTWYDGAPLSLHIVSITDGDGRAWKYDDGTTQDNVRQVKIGDPDRYVHGLTTYTIRYTMRDVVHRPTDRKIDEWYWDLLPLDSAQPIARFTSTIEFAPDIASTLTGDHACYSGPAGSTARCDLASDASSPSRFTVSQANVAAGSGVTVAFAMPRGTFVPAPARQPDPLTDVTPVPMAGAGVLLAIGGTISGVVGMRRRGRRSGRGIVVAQYDVPPSLPPLLAGQIEGKRSAATSSEIVHLAVRKTLRIEDSTKKRKPTLTLLDPSETPDPLDAAALVALFPNRKPGATLHLDTPNDALVSRLADLSGAAHDAALERGLLEQRRSRLAMALAAIGLTVGLAAAALAAPGMIVARPAAIASFVVSIILCTGAFLALLIARRRYTVLTAAGAETGEYLQGVREYIRLAEADRIRMLQSYTGAERRKDGSVDVVVLYERLLPYAMLFGMEREWGQVLAVQYAQEHSAPGWYAGYSSSNFTDSLSGMSNSLSATPTPSSSSSSSSSGSSGGGSSGGGGGGGSSGGW